MLDGASVPSTGGEEPHGFPHLYNLNLWEKNGPHNMVSPNYIGFAFLQQEHLGRKTGRTPVRPLRRRREDSVDPRGQREDPIDLVL